MALRLYGEMPSSIYAKWMGATIEEVEVRHYPKKVWFLEIGLERILKVLLDLMLIYVPRSLPFKADLRFWYV
jgi:dolichol-phosphate mannosyltransferase